MLHTFTQAITAIQESQAAAAAVPCQLLELFIAKHRGGPVPGATAPAYSKWEQAATARVLQLLRTHQPELLTALSGTGLPLWCAFDDDGLVLKLDTPAGSPRYFVQVRLQQPGFATFTGPEDEDAPGWLAGIAEWVPRLHGLDGQAITDNRAALHIAQVLKQKLTEPQAGGIAWQAEQAGRFYDPLPRRLQLAAQAPPMPHGWQSNEGKHPGPRPRFNYEKVVEGNGHRVASYEEQEAAWNLALAQYNMLQATIWPLAWADAMLLMYTAQGGPIS